MRGPSDPNLRAEGSALLLLLAACAGCPKAEPTAPGWSPAPGPPVAPAAAPGTVDAIMALPTDFIESYDPWDEGYAALVARLGPPSAVDGDFYYWAAVTGDVCAYVLFQRVDGADVNMSGTLIRPADPRGVFAFRYGPDDAMANRAMCFELAGVPDE